MGTDLVQRRFTGELHRVGFGPVLSGVEIPDVISRREADVKADALTRHVGIVAYQRPMQRNWMRGGRGKGICWKTGNISDNIMVRCQIRRQEKGIERFGEGK